jgi:hypothetical protein
LPRKIAAGLGHGRDTDLEQRLPGTLRQMIEDAAAGWIGKSLEHSVQLFIVHADNMQ